MKEEIREVVWNHREGGPGIASFYEYEKMGECDRGLPLSRFIWILENIKDRYPDASLHIEFSMADELEVLLYREETDEEEQERLNEEFYREINTLTGTLGDLVAKCEGDKMALAKAREISAKINKIINEKMRDHGNHSN